MALKFFVLYPQRKPRATNEKSQEEEGNNRGGGSAAKEVRSEKVIRH